MNIGKLAQKLFLVGAIVAGSMLTNGCEEVEEKPPLKRHEFEEYAPIPEGTANAQGSWYEPAHGERKDGSWGWGWSHLWLNQSGTELKGGYRLEKYSSHFAQGSLEGNNLHLDVLSFDDSIFAYIDGTVNGDRMKVNYAFNRSSDGKQIILTKKYSLLSREYGQTGKIYPAYHAGPTGKNASEKAEHDHLESLITVK